MNLRDFLAKLDKKGELTKIKKETNPYLEIPKLLKENDGKTILFEKVKGSDYKVVGNVCGSRNNFATAFNTKQGEELLKYIVNAIDNPKKPKEAKNPACQEVVEKVVDLNKIPILTHTTKELGAYITAGVFITKDPEYGTNMAYHRTARIGKNKLVARICQRDTYKFLERAKGDLPVAICIGMHPGVLLAAAISVETGVSELDIANKLMGEKLLVAKCKTNDIMVPSDAEIVLEGRITRQRTTEGPFIDITGTYDIVRKEPVIEIDCITHRKNPIYHGLVASLAEHRLLMGMPKEPVIYREVNKVCRCKDVVLTHGGCSWLHAAVKIEKKNEDDGKKAIEAAFRGHASLKHAVVVDEDIDINNIEDIEWAIATRSQAGKDMIIKHEKGSSLDASAEQDRTTYKAGIDATIPWGKPRQKFLRGTFGE
jgi:2,5-furandicarboxylate decarboxylase 1